MALGTREIQVAGKIVMLSWSLGPNESVKAGNILFHFECIR